MSRLLPTRFRLFWKSFKNREFNLLDVGAGSHSAQLTKQWFPRCNYYGIDKVHDYNNDDADFVLMTEFYEMDLTKLNFARIPEAFFDVMIMSHVIEHLYNGDEVLRKLLSKVRPGGYVYIEFPSARSLNLPSMKGTLNFHDDETHCRIFSVEEISNILKQNGYVIKKAGTRRDLVRMSLLPLLIIYSKIKLGYVEGSVFWDLLGFADYVFAQNTR